MSTTFAALGVPEPIVRALSDRGIDEPFPIQAATIPDALAGRDLCGKAPTGSGKTIAFGIPLVARVTRATAKRPKGLVLVPTRELALQVADELRNFSGDLRVLAAYGGANIEPQIKQLRQGVDILVACPGRLLDLIERRTCELRDVSFAVVDEADRMADMGFLPDVQRILDMTRSDRQTVLFSATLDGAIDKLVRGYQVNPVRHETQDEDPGNVTHHFWLTERGDKVALAAQVIAIAGPTVVFCRTRHGSDRVAKQLGTAGVKAAAIHGARSQSQRERALQAFHRGEIQALVATDVAARGIHVEGVLCVLHFDLPADPKDYVHRSGRTARAGNDGTVVALLEKSQRKDAVKLRKGAGVEGEVTEPDVSLLPVAAPFRAPAGSPKRPGGTTGGSRSGSAGKPRRADAGRSSSSAPRRDRPSRDDDRRWETSPSSKAKPAQSDRPAKRHADPEDRPAARGGSGSSAPSTRPKDRNSSKVKHAARKAAAAEAAPRTRPERSAAPAATPKPEASRPARVDDFPVGDARVRPSGAARRKARREAALAAGEEAPASAKRKRSGAPRTGKPRSKQGGSAGRSSAARS